ncbi:MFS transporter [Limnohabitans sp. Rim8]|uniref:MFS transporter n=1 Tax=Limnohabitans sp. Rim8 TaxID=1100718 RepID=UPI002623B95F|nr:MFS transporter [Limnohabitans sp. Rim8]
MTPLSLSELLTHKAFVRFWFSRLSGILAHQMLMVALAWHMYELTNSAWSLGLVGLFQFVPALLMTLPAGHWVDRLHKARIYAVCMGLQAVVAGLLIAASWGHFASPVLIYGISIVLGGVRAFQMPTQQALTPQLVPLPLLPRAIAMSSMGVQTAVIGGPALGGLLYAHDVTTVYAVCLALFLLAMALALWVRYHHQASSGAADMRTVLAGAVFVWNHKPLMGAITLDLVAVLLGGATALLPIFAKDILHTGPEGLGLLRAAPAVGSLIMSIVLTRWPLQRRVGHSMLAAVAVFGLANIVFGISQDLVLSMIALAVTGAADTISVVTRLTLMQLETPDDMRGRVSAVNSIFIGASNQLGEFESGATAALWGPVGSVVVGGVATVLVAAAWLRLFPDLAQRDRMVSNQ